MSSNKKSAPTSKVINHESLPDPQARHNPFLITSSSSSSDPLPATKPKMDVHAVFREISGMRPSSGDHPKDGDVLHRVRDFLPKFAAANDALGEEIKRGEEEEAVLVERQKFDDSESNSGSDSDSDPDSGSDSNSDSDSDVKEELNDQAAVFLSILNNTDVDEGIASTSGSNKKKKIEEIKSASETKSPLVINSNSNQEISSEACKNDSSLDRFVAKRKDWKKGLKKNTTRARYDIEHVKKGEAYISMEIGIADWDLVEGLGTGGDQDACEKDVKKKIKEI